MTRPTDDISQQRARPTPERPLLSATGPEQYAERLRTIESLWQAPVSGAPSSIPAETAGTGFICTPGTREIKVYPVTSHELWSLGGCQFSASLFFSLAGVSFGYWAEGVRDISLASNSGAHDFAFWRSLGDLALVAAASFAALGVVLFGASAWCVWGIIRKTRHRPAPDQARN